MGKTSRDRFVKENSGYTAPKIVASPGTITPIAKLRPGKFKIQGKLGTIKVIASKNKSHLIIYETHVTDKSGSIRTIWFNKPRIIYSNRDIEYIFLGKVEISIGSETLVDPIFTRIEEVERWQDIYNHLKK